MGYDRFGRSDQPLVFGHEFSGEVAEYGPGASASSRPARRSSRCRSSAASAGVDTVGLSVHAPGAYAEQLLVAGVADAAGARTAWPRTSRR